MSQSANSTTSDKLNTGKKNSTANEKLSQAMAIINKAKNQKISETKEDLRDTLQETQERYEELKTQASDVIKTSRKNMEQNIETNPYRYIIGASLVGLTIGYLLSRRR